MYLSELLEYTNIVVQQLRVAKLGKEGVVYTTNDSPDLYVENM